MIKSGESCFDDFAGQAGDRTDAEPLMGDRAADGEFFCEKGLRIVQPCHPIQCLRVICSRVSCLIHFFQMDPFLFRVPHTVMNTFKEVIYRAAEDHVKRQNVQFRVGVQGLLCIILPGISYHFKFGVQFNCLNQLVAHPMIDPQIHLCTRAPVVVEFDAVGIGLRLRGLVHVVVVGIVKASDHHGQAYACPIPPAIRIVFGPHGLAEVKKLCKAQVSDFQISAVRGKQSAEGVAYLLWFAPCVISQCVKGEFRSIVDGLLRQQHDGGQLRGKVRIIRRKRGVHHRAEFCRDLPLVYFIVVTGVQLDKPCGIVIDDLIKVASVHCAHSYLPIGNVPRTFPAP